MEPLLTVLIGGGFALVGTILGGLLVWRGDSDRTKRDLLIRASADFEEAFAVVLTQIIHSRLILEARVSGDEHHHKSCVESSYEHHVEMVRAINSISRLRGFITLAGSAGLAEAHQRLTKGIPDGQIAYLEGDENQLLVRVEDQGKLWSSLGETFRKKLKNDFDQIGTANLGFVCELTKLLEKLRS